MPNKNKDKNKRYNCDINNDNNCREICEDVNNNDFNDQLVREIRNLIRVPQYAQFKYILQPAPVTTSLTAQSLTIPEPRNSSSLAPLASDTTPNVQFVYNVAEPRNTFNTPGIIINPSDNTQILITFAGTYRISFHANVLAPEATLENPAYLDMLIIINGQAYTDIQVFERLISSSAIDVSISALAQIPANSVLNLQQIYYNTLSIIASTPGSVSNIINIEKIT